MDGVQRQAVTQAVEAFRRRVEQRRGAVQSTQKEIGLKQKEIVQAEAEQKRVEDALLLVRACITRTGARKSYVENILSEALTDVYSKPLQFVLQTQTDAQQLNKGVKPMMRFAGGPLRDLRKCMGRGSIDVCNILFNMLVLLLTKRSALLIVADEPTPFISPDMQDDLKKFLHNICIKTGMQLIMTTQNESPFGTVWDVDLVEDKQGWHSVIKCREDTRELPQGKNDAE